MDTVILIPAYKPSEALLKVARSMSETSCTVLIVDDGSGEDYAALFTQAEEMKGVTVLHQFPNQGKGAALKHGIAYVMENMPSCEYIVTADADGQHTPTDIHKVSAALHEKGGFVIGVRHFEGQVPWRSRFGNSITKLVFWVAAGKKCTDTQTGLRGFSRELFPYMKNIRGNRYEYEMNVLMQCAQGGVAIQEISIETVYENNNSSSHFRAVIDSIRIYGIIFFYSSLVRYGLSAIFSFLLDFAAFSVFSHFIPNPAAVPTILALCVSSPVNYLINRKLVFNSNANKAASFVSYIALVACSALARSGLMTLFIDNWEWNRYGSYVLVQVIFFVINFIIQKLFIFKNKKKD